MRPVKTVDLRPSSRTWRLAEGRGQSIGGAARATTSTRCITRRAVVGVNTSGMIESGIIGKPVYACKSRNLPRRRTATLHFQHLKNVDGGCCILRHARGARAQLARLPATEKPTPESRRFIQDSSGRRSRCRGTRRGIRDRAFRAGPPLARRRRPRCGCSGSFWFRRRLLTVFTLERNKLRAVLPLDAADALDDSRPGLAAITLPVVRRGPVAWRVGVVA